LRENHEVLFRYVSGEAYWTYIDLLYENSKSYSIIPNIEKGAEIHEGDTIITSGNLNLAHRSKVEILNGF
jgi:membrane fusion protein, multidrug efflux system